MTPGIRLENCGDLLTLQEYSDWARQSAKTTFNQMYRGGLLVQPWSLKPKPVWRRADLEAALGRRDLVVEQRKQRVRRRMGLVRAS